MKIGIYAGTIPPPVFINNLVNGLADKNDTVILYGKASERNYKFSSPAIIQRKVPVTKLGIILYSIYALSKLVIMQPQLYLTIVKMLRQNSTNWIQFLKSSCRVLPPFLDNLDIFHIQWAKTLVQYPEFIEQLKCPVVLSLRGAHINYSPLSDKVLAQKYMKYFPMVAGFHAVSAAISLEAQKYGADPKKITIIPPAVKSELTEKWAVEKSIQINDELKIISVGRCHWKKGYTYALDAMALLKKKDVQFHYTIIAGGRDQENILYQIHDLRLNKCVSFINDKLSHDEVLKKVSECDLFLLPSLEEGISNAVLEAMALGIPVISTDCGGMGEVIRNSENGFLVPVRDSESMAKAIQNFNDLDKMKKNNIIFNARGTLIHNHLLSYQVDQFKSYYSKIV